MRRRGRLLKRGRSWCIVLYLGRDPQTRKEKRKWLTYPTQREAEAALAQHLMHLDGGGAVPTTKLRVGEYLDQWLQDYARGRVALTTLKSYRDTIRLHLAPALGHYPLRKVSPQAIQGYLSRKQDEGRLSTTTLRYHAMLLHEALGHAVKWGLLARNPADLIDPPRRRRTEMRVWDEEQVRLFLAEAKRSSPHYSLYLAALTTGMRQGELLGLRWQDVNPAFGTASVRQTFYRLAGQQLWKEPKTEKARRTVALPAVLVEELRRLREEQAERRRLFGADYHDHDLVFCQINGKPLHAHNVAQRDFRRVIERVGLPRIRFHDLRHCHASLLLALGVHPKIVQERLGHANISMTLDTYSHVVPGMQEQAVRALEARLLVLS